MQKNENAEDLCMSFEKAEKIFQQGSLEIPVKSLAGK